MAKKAGSKSQAIREYLDKKPTAGPKEVIAALKQKNIEVTVGLVSNVKYASKNKKAKKPGRATQQRVKPFDALLAVKTLTDRFGEDNVQEALNVLKKL